MTNGTKERVGIVGVGRMGMAMLKHLVRHGHPVTACDLSAEQLAKARAAGATTADSPAALAKAADIVILGVGYAEEVNAVVFAIVLRMGGSISAEHGIGVLKRNELPEVKDKVAIELMRGIKAMLDPLGIMNPGKVL